MKLPVFIFMLWSISPKAAARTVISLSYQPDYEDEEEQVVQKGSLNDTSNHLGAFCDGHCSPKLVHVQCNNVTRICECEKSYPVKLNPYKGCSTPNRLGEQCYYKEACQYTDQHSSCQQIHHKAVCQCMEGYHSVSMQKPAKRVFCAEDVVLITSDFSTFVGVISGIAVLTGLICFVLHLFNQNLYGPRRQRFGNADFAPPIMFSNQEGALPMPNTELNSQTSSHRTLTSYQSRRPSSAPGFRVSASRAGAARTAAILLLSCHMAPYDVSCTPNEKLGSRRPSVTSIHSTGSIRSYSSKRYEREREQKEEREMQKRLSKMTSMNSTNRFPPTPSPHSTDDLLPTLEEDAQLPPLAVKEESTTSFHEDLPSTSKQFP